jgi:AraC family transcriptional regulator
MQPTIETVAPKRLVGVHLRMSLEENRTAELWRSFMPRRGEVSNRVDSSFISMQVHDDFGANLFSPTTEFTKWAVVEVFTHGKIPDGMESCRLSGGQYAIFHHQGPASAAPQVFQHIFGVWLPSSEFELDDRERFELLPKNYSPVAPDAEEDIFIPIRPKT